MTLQTMTPKAIHKMSYNELIGITRETNRPPGGINTIIRVAQSTFLSPGDNVLEIGTSTGFSAIELAKVTKANIHAVDINPVSLSEATQRAIRYGVSEKILFKHDDATALSYQDNFFDLVFCGNVTSLVSDRTKALKEYCRVLKRGKYLAAVPMYYIKEPSGDLIERVSNAIQVRITPHDKKYWMDFFVSDDLEPFFTEDYKFDEISAERVESFVDRILLSPHLVSLDKEAYSALSKRYRSYMHLFRENLSHMGFTIIILRKESEPMDNELFTATRI